MASTLDLDKAHERKLDIMRAVKDMNRSQFVGVLIDLAWDANPELAQLQHGLDNTTMAYLREPIHG